MNERFVRLTPEDPETVGFEARSTTGDLAQTFDVTADPNVTWLPRNATKDTRGGFFE